MTTTATSGPLNKALIVIPTYNERENILGLLREVTYRLPEADILVVDDSSPDGTAKLVKSFQLQSDAVHLLSREKKDGLAAAYQAGFQWGLERNYTFLSQMDADFSHAPSDLPRLYKAIEEADVAVGCRYIEGGGVSGWPWYRKVISRGGTIYAKIILGLPFEDLTGGFNVWRREVLEKILTPTPRSQGYAFQVELKHRAHQNNFRIAEVPIHFHNRTAGKSKMSSGIVWEAALRVLQMRRQTAKAT